MANVKELVNGTMQKTLEEQIDATSLYNITNLYEIVSATNDKMTQEYVQSGFYKKDALILCTDNGTYKKGIIYRFNGFGFIPFATIPEIVKSISSTSTDEQVPSAKSVYDKIEEIYNTIEQLDNIYAPKSSVQIERL